MLFMRKVSFSVLAGLLLTVLLLSGCQTGAPVEVDPLIDPLPGAQPTSAVTPTEHFVETLEPAPQASPTPELGDTGGNRCEVEGQETFSSPAGNFCFAYPSDFEFLGSGNPLQALLIGPALDNSVEPVRAGLYLRAEKIDPNTMDLEQAVARVLAQFAGMQVEIQQTPITFGGQPAIQLEPVPGREGSRDVLFIHNDLLYHATFTPAVQDYPQAQADVERLFESVVSSFSILSP